MSGLNGLNYLAQHSRIAAVLGAALAIAACAKAQPEFNADAGAIPGSAQDFAQNVGDRVFFESDSSDLTPKAQATLDRQVAWLQRYDRGPFTVEGNADERGTREYNFALGARRAARDQRLSRRPRHSLLAHPHDQLRQGTPGRGLQRHFVLVAEPPGGHRGQRRAELTRLPYKRECPTRPTPQHDRRSQARPSALATRCRRD